MKDDYKIKKETANVSIQVEKEIVEALKAMETYSKHTVSEIANTALKRYISSHKDFLPPDYNKGKSSF